MKQLANKLKLARILHELLMNINLVPVGLSITKEAAQLGFVDAGRATVHRSDTDLCISIFCVASRHHGHEGEVSDAGH